MKRVLASLVAALVLLTPLAGCLAEVSLPLVTEPTTLTCFMETDVKWSATRNSVAEVSSYQEIMNKTGVTVQFDHPAAGQTNEQFNLMVASNILPDMIYYNWAGVTGGPAKYIEDGVILPLNEYLEKWAPNFMAYMEKYPDVRKQSVLDDGTFYMFPMLRIDEESGAGTWFKTMGFMIRQDWLDKLGLSMPTTKDELHDVLVAFRDGDPNGNGEKDEIPYASVKEAGYNIEPFAGMFGVVNGFYLDGSEVKYGPIQPAFKEYLQTMRDWYAEGLIDPEYAMTDGSSLTAKITTDTVGLTYYLLAGGMGTWSNMMADSDFDLQAMPWPSLTADSKPYTTVGEYAKVVTGVGVAITPTAIKDGTLEAAIKFRDYFYSPEGVLDSNFGIEGESYTMVDGEPIFTDAVLHNDKGLTTTQALSQYVLSASNDAMVKSAKYFKQVTLMLDNQKASQPVWNQAALDLLMPNISLTSDESSLVASSMSEISTYADEMIMKFILGQESLDNFDTFVRNIENMGIADVLACEQAAYDRYQAR
ncbi:MAG: hypothetical protein ACI4ML_03360 [Aristaeellaceae bacterium]